MTVNMNDKPVLWLLTANLDITGRTDKHRVMCVGSKNDCLEDANKIIEKTGFTEYDSSDDCIRWSNSGYNAYVTMALELYENHTDEYIRHHTNKRKFKKDANDAD